MKILLTGDLHLGRSYKSEENAAAALRYSTARMDALRKLVHTADEEGCDYIVIAGDLYDRRRQIPDSMHEDVCGALGEFSGTVLILPGNHDYYDESDNELWTGFRKYAGQNMILLSKDVPYDLGDAVFCPCICTDRYSESNSLGWLKEIHERIGGRMYIGVAHGAIEGLSYDREKKYYYMTKKELEECRMDLWLIGHTHMPYPDREETAGERIFNAGTHQQTDIADNSPGSVFIIEADGNGIHSKMVHTGVIAFVRREVMISHGEHMREKIGESLRGLDEKNTSVRLVLKGVALKADWDSKSGIYREYEERFLKFEFIDSDLHQEITKEMIDEKTLEGTAENRLLKLYMDEPVMLDLAYRLVLESMDR